MSSLFVFSPLSRRFYSPTNTINVYYCGHGNAHISSNDPLRSEVCSLTGDIRLVSPGPRADIWIWVFARTAGANRPENIQDTVQEEVWAITIHVRVKLWVQWNVDLCFSIPANPNPYTCAGPPKFIQSKSINVHVIRCLMFLLNVHPLNLKIKFCSPAAVVLLYLLFSSDKMYLLAQTFTCWIIMIKAQIYFCKR